MKTLMTEKNGAKPLDEFILEQELDEIPSYCGECGKVHGPEACQYDDFEAGEDYHLNRG